MGFLCVCCLTSLWCLGENLYFLCLGSNHLQTEKMIFWSVLGTGSIALSRSIWLGVITDFSEDENVLFFKLFVVNLRLECLWSLKPWAVTRSWGQFANDWTVWSDSIHSFSSFHPKDASGRERHRETKFSERVVSVASSHVVLIKVSQVELVILTRRACSKLKKKKKNKTIETLWTSTGCSRPREGEAASLGCAVEETSVEHSRLRWLC